MEISVLFCMNLLEFLLVAYCVVLTVRSDSDRSGAPDPEVTDHEVEK